MNLNIGRDLNDNPVISRADMGVLIPQIMQSVIAINKSKGREYSGDDNALLNFQKNGVKLGLTAEHILLVYADKHWDSITTYIKDLGPRVGADGKLGCDRPALSEPIYGRIQDVITYLTLFSAMCLLRDNEEAALNQDLAEVCADAGPVEADDWTEVEDPDAFETRMDAAEPAPLHVPSARSPLYKSEVFHEASGVISGPGHMAPRIEDMTFGKLLRIVENGQELYLRARALTPDRNLVVATDERGSVYKIDPSRAKIEAWSENGAYSAPLLVLGSCVMTDDGVHEGKLIHVMDSSSLSHVEGGIAVIQPSGGRERISVALNTLIDVQF